MTVRRYLYYTPLPSQSHASFNSFGQPSLLTWSLVDKHGGIEQPNHRVRHGLLCLSSCSLDVLGLLLWV